MTGLLKNTQLVRDKGRIQTQDFLTPKALDVVSGATLRQAQSLKFHPSIH